MEGEVLGDGALAAPKSIMIFNVPMLSVPGLVTYIPALWLLALLLQLEPGRRALWLHCAS